MHQNDIVFHELCKLGLVFFARYTAISHTMASMITSLITTDFCYLKLQAYRNRPFSLSPLKDSVPYVRRTVLYAFCILPKMSGRMPIIIKCLFNSRHFSDERKFPTWTMKTDGFCIRMT